MGSGCTRYITEGMTYTRMSIFLASFFPVSWLLWSEQLSSPRPFHPDAVCTWDCQGMERTSETVNQNKLVFLWIIGCWVFCSLRQGEWLRQRNTTKMKKEKGREGKGKKEGMTDDPHQNYGIQDYVKYNSLF